MYHVELRQFPHNFCRFNLTEQQLREGILDAWARGDWIELGERKWSPHQAKLTVLDGPELSVDRLSMGRGWRSAVRQGRDVTEELLSAVRAAIGASAAVRTGTEPVASPGGQKQLTGESGTAFDAAGWSVAPGDARLAADSLGLEVLAKLGVEPRPIAIAWQLAQARYPKRSASDCLKLAEYAISSLARAGLAVVLVSKTGGEPEPCVSAEQVERLLHPIDSWSSDEPSKLALVRRA